MGKKLSKLLGCPGCSVYKYPIFIAASAFIIFYLTLKNNIKLKAYLEKHHAGGLSVRNTQNGALFCIEIPLQQGGN